MWYYAENSEQRGPVTKEDLGAKLQSGELTRDTLVWTNNMRNWEKACDVDDLKEFLGTASVGSAAKSEQSHEWKPIANLDNNSQNGETAADQSHEWKPIANLDNNSQSNGQAADTGLADDSSPIGLRPAGAGVGADTSAQAGANAAQQAAQLTCQRCGRAVSPSLALNYQGTIICPDCKQQFLHDLYEQHGTNHVDYPPAEFWPRVAAYIVDSIINWIIGMMIGGGIGFLIGIAGAVLDASDVAIALAQFVGFMVNLCFFVFYETFFICKYGATPGKMLLGLKVLHNGENLSAGRAVGRAFAKMLSGYICGIGYFIAAFRQDNKALHDMMCDTIVVSTK